MYRRYSQTGDGAVSMTQVTRNRIKNGIILLLIVATAAVLAFSLPVLSKQNDARRLYIQRIQSETAEAVRQTSGLSRNAGADSAAILARIRCNVYAVRTINSTNSAALSPHDGNGHGRIPDQPAERPERAAGHRQQSELRNPRGNNR